MSRTHCKECNAVITEDNRALIGWRYYADGSRVRQTCSYCKKCRSKLVAESYRKKHPLKREPRRTPDSMQPDGAMCRQCGKLLDMQERQARPSSEKDKRGTPYYRFYHLCTACRSKRAHEYYEKRKERINHGRNQ